MPREINAQALKQYVLDAYRQLGAWNDLALPPPLPEPPHPYLAHPYALQENFTGRLHERQMLTSWFTGDPRPVLALVAMGGMGKSSLAWVWLQHDLLGLPLPGPAPAARGESGTPRVPDGERPEGVLWWSFYDSEARFATFVESALAYAYKSRLDTRRLSLHDKVRELVYLLQERYFVLVLDGFERELRAYASLSAVYQGDTVAEDSLGDYRACTDLQAAYFLRWAASGPLKSRILLTSRLFPLELDGLDGCRREDLTAMDPEDAVAFFHAQGVRGTRARIEAACQPCGYHPLTLRLLSGMITNDPARPGDIDAVAEYDLSLAAAGRDPAAAGREQRVLALAYEALRPPLRELLSRLSAFRSPVEYEVAALLSPLTGRRELGLAFNELRDRGLIFFDEERWRYDLHPIVRAYAYDHLSDKERIHNQLRDYFAAAPLPATGQIASLDDLSPAIELYHHAACAGRYDEAARLFRDHLAEPLYYLLGAYRTEIDLLQALFPDGPGDPPDSGPAASEAAPGPAASEAAPGPEAGPASQAPETPAPARLPAVQDPGTQAWICNALAGSYTLSGQLRQAVPLLKTHNTLQETLGSVASLAIGLGNLASVQLEMGQLKEAEANLRASIERSKQAGKLSIEASSRAHLGRLLAYEGAFYQAEQQIEVAIQERLKTGQPHLQLLSHIHRAQVALLTGLPELALQAAELAEEALFSSEVAPPARSLVWVYWLLGAAHVELQRLEDAEGLLGEALNRCRHINLVELEPDILLSWAHWHHVNGTAEQAVECAEEALVIASRSAYRLKEAQIYNLLAHCALDGGDPDRAREYAGRARERAWCDGPPHYYKLALDEAEGLLALILDQGVGRAAAPARRPARGRRRPAPQTQATGLSSGKS